MSVSLQRKTFWVLSAITIAIMLYVPYFLIRYGASAIFTQSFGEGIVIEVLGAIGTAILVVNIEIFAVNSGIVADDDIEQAKAMQTELAAVKKQLEEIKLLLAKTPPTESESE